ncbi:hypothetical protein FOZ60_006567 [Perkinsus olseni]|uniref:Uncharacterized protein n=3 Tax=Perkinsus olseni TaxID=32597 RepID=A0A7J6NNM7_PEROL|nr:hypothetical protein FOZ60_006567 [Perkinsus olseni]
MSQPNDTVSGTPTHATIGGSGDERGRSTPSGSQWKRKIIGIIKGTDYLIQFPLWLYLVLMMSIAIIGAAGFNALFAYIAYPSKNAARADVWVWPDSIAFDLVITALLSFGITWMLSPTAAMRDIVVR